MQRSNPTPTHSRRRGGDSCGIRAVQPVRARSALPVAPVIRSRQAPGLLLPVLGVLALLLPEVWAAADGGKEDSKVNYLDIAALMLRDGNPERARTALDQVDIAALQVAHAQAGTQDNEQLQDSAQVGGGDLGRYWALRGTLHRRLNELPMARDAFMRAVAAGRDEAAIHLTLAQINYSLEDYRAALAALAQAGSAVDHIASVYHLKAQAHWLLGERVRALAILNQAAGIFPQEHSFLRRKIFYLIDLKLYRQAARLGREYLRITDGSAGDYIAIGTALRQSGATENALRFLESARLRYPNNVNVHKALAHAYIDAGRLHSAADLLYQAALLDSGLLPEAAEVYRRAGALYRALTLNAAIADQQAKLKQRLALLLELRRFEQAAAMQNDLRRNGLLDDEDIRYALAFALFKTGDYQASERHLGLLTRSDLLRKANEVRRAMQECAGKRWQCA